MGYRFIYSRYDVNRIVPAVIIDKRAAIPAISGKDGATIKAYTDAKAASASSAGVVFYKIETTNGNLVGYFYFSASSGDEPMPDNEVTIELRPPFQDRLSTISQEIATFITGNNWRFEHL